MGTVTSQGGESGWSLATGFCISHFRGRGERHCLFLGVYGILVQGQFLRRRSMMEHCQLIMED